MLHPMYHRGPDKGQIITATARALARGADVEAAESRSEGDAAAFRARFGVLEGLSLAMAALERARAEALGAGLYPGARTNIAEDLGADTLHDAAFCALTGLPGRGEVYALARRHLGGVDPAAREAYAAACKDLLAALGIDEAPAPAPAPEDGQDEGAVDRPDGATGHGTGQDAKARPAGSASGPHGAAPPGLHASGYRVYTRTYDRVVRPGDLAGASELGALRAQLDAAVAPHRAAIARLAAKLTRLLAARRCTHWDFDQEAGNLDAGRLARLIARAESAPRVFRQERAEPGRGTAVALLLDNSGSMRGRPIALSAVTAELMARALERAGVAVEILGFTTAAWKGGRARADWLTEGSPDAPGRLNEVLHIVYKAAPTPWRRARAGLALMLKEGLLKENIDGEALAWAHARLLARPEGRRVLVVVSDGAPVDDATMAANGAGYLEADLHAVVDAIGRRGAVQLAAIGIGHDVGRHYPRAVTIKDADALAPALAAALEDLLA
ncbi:MAG: cobaltochelatase subunit CobT [Alphaproteobacteria bacterium]|jgi:cobaltochelatase CobT|nr:cobaltochelatase subunit CobT [Alphaproteobacteria bacterium]